VTPRPGEQHLPGSGPGVNAQMPRRRRGLVRTGWGLRGSERNSVADLVNLDRKDVVRTGALGTIRPHTVLLVEATSPSVLSAYPGREVDLASGPYVLNRRIHQDPSHSRPCKVFRDIQASELRGPHGDVVLGARQHVRVADDTTSLLRDEDLRAGGGVRRALGRSRRWSRPRTWPPVAPPARDRDSSSAARRRSPPRWLGHRPVVPHGRRVRQPRAQSSPKDALGRVAVASRRN
jgi:hypothetical protein